MVNQFWWTVWNSPRIVLQTLISIFVFNLQSRFHWLSTIKRIRCEQTTELESYPFLQIKLKRLQLDYSSSQLLTFYFYQDCMLVTVHVRRLNSRLLAVQERDPFCFFLYTSDIITNWKWNRREPALWFIDWLANICCFGIVKYHIVLKLKCCHLNRLWYIYAIGPCDNRCN